MKKKLMAIVMAGMMLLGTACGMLGGGGSGSGGAKPVLGQAKDTNYEGFTYLYGERLTTESALNEKTGKMEAEDIIVFLPKSDYPYVNRARANSETLGVEVRIELNPYSSRRDANLTLKERLTKSLKDVYESDYSYRPYYDLEEGEPSAVTGKDNIVTAQVFYTQGDYKDTYDAYCVTYVLTQLENGVSALTTVTVKQGDTRENTAALLEELGAFYQTGMYWNSEKALAAAKKINANPPETPGANSDVVPPVIDTDGEAPVVTKGADATTVLMQGVTFTLPAGWDVNDNLSSPPFTTFSPETGDVSDGNMFVSAVDTQLSGDSAATTLTPELMELMAQAMLKGVWGDTDATFTDLVEVEGISAGRAYVCDISLTGGAARMYAVFVDGIMVSIGSAALGDLSETALATLLKVVQSIAVAA